MDGDQNKKVIIKDFEYKREYSEHLLPDGSKFLDTGNYKTWSRDIAVSCLKAEDIVTIDDSVKKFAEKTQEKFRELFDVRNNTITDGQVKFSYDATLCIMGRLKKTDKITIIPAKAGFGKSSYIYSYLSTLCDHISSGGLANKFSKQGVIIVTDKIETLRQLERDILQQHGYYEQYCDRKTEYTYILEAWNQNSYKDGICLNEAIESYEYGMCSSDNCPYFNSCKMIFLTQ